jgi:thioredoxin-dependent peroxiredoxin
MATIQLKGNPIHTSGELPFVGSMAPSFELVKTDLSVLTNKDVKGKRVLLNIFPSLDTQVCAASVRRFNTAAAEMDNVAVVCVSKDLPFANGRFCTTEGIGNVMAVSDFRDGRFGTDYGVTILDGPLTGLHSRAVVVLNEAGEVVYREQVADIVQEPDYDAALAALKK